jgi:hypothetical protein
MLPLVAQGPIPFPALVPSRLQGHASAELDWTGLSAQAIVNRVIEGGGGVVLMHFQGPHTLEALRQLDVGPLTGQG